MWALLLATHLAPSIAVTTFTSMLALATGRGAGTLWVAGAALTGQFSVGWANDWLDADRDRMTGRQDKPVVTGRVSVRTLRTAALIALTLAVPLSFASGVRAGSAHVLALTLGWAYDLGLKATPLSVLPYAGAFALLPVFVALGAPGGTGVAWWAPVGSGLLGAGAHFTNALPDLADDARTGVRGLPQRLGATGSVLAGAILLGSGVLIAGLGPGGTGGAFRAAMTAAGLGCVAAAVLTGLTGRPRHAFPWSMAAAACVIAAMVSAGQQLA